MLNSAGMRCITNRNSSYNIITTWKIGRYAILHSPRSVITNPCSTCLTSNCFNYWSIAQIDGVIDIRSNAAAQYLGVPSCYSISVTHNLSISNIADGVNITPH